MDLLLRQCGIRGSSSKQPLLLHYRSSTPFIIVVTCIAIFTHLHFYGMLVPVTPTALEERAGVPREKLQKWNSILQAIYGGATLLTSPLAGWFTDNMGTRRIPFLLCLVCLAGATALLAVGTNVNLWIAGRLLQGVSAGMLWVACLALLSDTVGTAGIGQAVGIIGIPMSLGPIIGPLLGGVIYASGGYKAVFGLMFALLAVDAVLRLVMIEKQVARRWLPDETAQTATEGSIPRTSKSPDLGSADKATRIGPETDRHNIPKKVNESTVEEGRGFSSGLLGQHKLSPFLRLLLSFRILVGLSGGLLQSSLNVAFDSTLPLVVADLFGWKQTGQGLIFITILIPSLLQPVFGKITDKYQHGRRLFAAGGCILATPAYALLRLVTYNSVGQKVLLCALLVIIGLAMAIAMPAIIAEIGVTVAAIEQEDPQAVKGGTIATGWSLVNAAYAAGCLIGPLFAGLIRNAAGWQTTTWCLSLLSGFTGVYLLLFLGGWIGKFDNKTLTTGVAR